MPNDLTFSAKLPSVHANRHAWALEMYGKLLAEAMRKDTSAEAREVGKLPEEQIAAHIVRIIMEKADPTRNKGLTAWLVGQYAQGKLRLEDLGTANETLTMFRRYAQRLEKNQRDLGQYPSLTAVWEAVIGFANAEEQHLSGKAQKALDRDRAYAESRILRQDPDGFTVAVPLTEFAAKWWGRGTRWCTAAGKRNQFWYYAKQGPLIVIVIPEMGKFQIWATEKDAQFVDAADRLVSADLGRKLWRWTKPILLTLIERSGLILSFIPSMHRNPNLCLVAVQQNGWALQWVPKAGRTYDICLAAVRLNGLALELVPEEHRTPELCLAAVQATGWALQWVPEELRSSDLCRIAVGQKAISFESVPKSIMTQDFFSAVLPKNSRALQYIQKRRQTYDLCLAAMRQDGRALQWVAQKHRTYDVYLAAVQTFGRALEWVPLEYQTAELCLAAVRNEGNALERVPQEHRTPNLWLAAVKQHGVALTHVPPEHRSHDLCYAAVKQSWRALVCVPEEHRTFEVYLAALKQTLSALEDIPPHLHADLLAEMPPEPEPITEWSPELLDAWAEKLQAGSSQLRTRHA